MATAAKRVPECTFKFVETPLKGAFVIEIERREDERGFFPRTLCQREFAQHGLESTVAQAKVAFNHNISRWLVAGSHACSMSKETSLDGPALGFRLTHFGPSQKLQLGPATYTCWSRSIA